MISGSQMQCQAPADVLQPLCVYRGMFHVGSWRKCQWTMSVIITTPNVPLRSASLLVVTYSLKDLCE